MVHQAGRVTDTVSGQINEPVPRQRHSQGRKKINQLQEGISNRTVGSSAGTFRFSILWRP